jgi:hypothetical protein
MPFDFPASPVLNQIFTAPTGQGYVYSGTAWNLAQTSPQAPVASDNPPANPYAGQLWLRSTTGALYMWYADPNSSQWIQIPGAIPPVAPQAWELIETRTVPAAAASVDFINLSAFKMLRLIGWLVSTGGTGGALLARVSANNGSSYDAGATDYAMQVATVTNTVASNASANTTQIQLGSGSGTGQVTVDIRITKFNQAAITQLLGSTSGSDGASAVFVTQFGGQRANTVAHNAFRLLLNSGTFSGGELMLEGVRG